MGYSTDFFGRFDLDKPLSLEQITTLEKFNRERHESREYPGIWCQWVPSMNGGHIEWDGGEKFYNYVEWLQYVVKNFLEPWGRKLNGEVTWQGEESNDMGKIVVENNVVKVLKARVVYE